MRLLWAFSIAVAMAAPASSQDIVLGLDLKPAGLSAVPTETPAHERSGFDTSDTILSDVSASMENHEIDAALNGVILHYSSDKAHADYARGICSKVTMIFYATNAVAVEPHIICSVKDVQDFAGFLENIDISAVRREAQRDTRLVKALNETAAVYRQEASQNISVGMRRVVVITDAQGGIINHLKSASLELTKDFGATVSAITINKPVLARVFESILVTNKEVAGQYYIRHGLSVSAQDGDAISQAVEQAMRFTQG